MNKKIIAVLAAVGLFTSGAFAGSTFQDISVSFDAVQKIIIFGQDKTPTDVKAFVYNNSTYVPLRYVSEQLKVPVSWDAATGTVYLGETPVRTDDKAVTLSGMRIASTYKAYLYRINNSTEPAFNVDQDAGFSFPQTFIMRLMKDPGHFKATAYENGIAIKAYEGGTALYYKLNGKYKTLTGSLGFDSELNNKSYKDFTVKIIGDGKTLQEINLSSGKLFQDISLNVAGVDTLSFDLSYAGTDRYEPIIDLADMTLQ